MNDTPHGMVRLGAAHNFIEAGRAGSCAWLGLRGVGGGPKLPTGGSGRGNPLRIPASPCKLEGSEVLSSNRGLQLDYQSKVRPQSLGEISCTTSVARRHVFEEGRDASDWARERVTVIDRGEKLPAKYKCQLFESVPEVELVWGGK